MMHNEMILGQHIIVYEGEGPTVSGESLRSTSNRGFKNDNEPQGVWGVEIVRDFILECQTRKAELPQDRLEQIQLRKEQIKGKGATDSLEIMFGTSSDNQVSAANRQIAQQMIPHIIRRVLHNAMMKKNKIKYIRCLLSYQRRLHHPELISTASLVKSRDKRRKKNKQ